MFVANSSDSSYSLRSTAKDLMLPKKNSSNGQKCFSYNGAKMWNNVHLIPFYVIIDQLQKFVSIPPHFQVTYEDK